MNANTVLLTNADGHHCLQHLPPTAIDRALQLPRDGRRNTMVEPRLSYLVPSRTVDVLSPPPSIKTLAVEYSEPAT